MAPPEFVATLSEQPFDVTFHPSRALVAVALVSGRTETFPFSASAGCGAVRSSAAHGGSACRAVRFAGPGGAVLASAGADAALLLRDVHTGATLVRLAKAHGAAINRLEVAGEHLLTTGERAQPRGGREGATDASGAAAAPDTSLPLLLKRARATTAIPPRRARRRRGPCAAVGHPVRCAGRRPCWLVAAARRLRLRPLRRHVPGRAVHRLRRRNAGGDGPAGGAGGQPVRGAGR